jgi:hypothetical protein
VSRTNGFLVSTLETLKDVDAEVDCDSASSSFSRRLSNASSSSRRHPSVSKRSASMSLAGFPVLTWSSFLEFLRSRVNPLALECHVEKLARQLQLMGRLVILDTPKSRAGVGGWDPREGNSDSVWEDGEDGSEEDTSLVVLSPQWLGIEVIGKLLSLEFRGVARPSGVYSLDDFTVSRGTEED